ncbi:hypothetical protein OAY86_00180 [Candidatus Pelagibacter sp.]|nr:hypothetical protein [Candidatus Pelagibacter sp.]|tara:strand:- start:303 stop:431 length:129 start_codon:yes stop_codon:yes gene_type:complete
MIKNIILTLLLCCIIFSCGKKGDPEYKKSEENIMQIIIKNKV